MTYELSEEEKAGVLATSDDKRYGYLVNKAADWGEVFALKMGDNWASLTTDEQKYFPIWPHPGFTEDVLTGDWEDAVAEPIEVHDFLDVLARLEELGDEVALFCTPDRDFITVPPEPLANDLRAALAEIE
jgi:Protein of unknown function (DUF2750)